MIFLPARGLTNSPRSAGAEGVWRRQMGFKSNVISTAGGAVGKPMAADGRNLPPYIADTALRRGRFFSAHHSHTKRIVKSASFEMTLFF